ncbi:hypothetical protein PQX77_015967, partial [Marasmius sp. AFHP31]
MLPDDTPRMAKRIKAHTEQVCKDAKLNTPVRQAVERFSQLSEHERHISLFAGLQGVQFRMDQQVKQESELTETRRKDKLLGSTFKTKLYGQIMTCLLSPNISCYLNGVTEAVMALIAKEPVLFNVTKKVLEDQGHYATLRSIVVGHLTQVRSAIKVK